MLQEIIEASHSYLVTIILALISLLASVTLAVIYEIRRRLLSWIDSRTSKEQRELIRLMSVEAFSFAEMVYNHTDSKKKLDAANNYLRERLKEKGINISSDEIRAAIECAVMEFHSAREKMKK